jgi:hypothetical protein
MSIGPFNGTKQQGSRLVGGDAAIQTRLTPVVEDKKTKSPHGGSRID